jgi:SpoVK/Ycf46/Vps4 family AAA+-type ATPase
MLTDSAHGYVGADLAALVDDAALNALRRQVLLDHGAAPPSPASHPSSSYDATVTPADFELAKTHITPSAMREVSLEVPSVRWDDIGGQLEVKQVRAGTDDGALGDLLYDLILYLPPCKSVKHLRMSVSYFT